MTFQILVSIPVIRRAHFLGIVLDILACVDRIGGILERSTFYATKRFRGQSLARLQFLEEIVRINANRRTVGIRPNRYLAADDKVPL